MRRSLLLLLVLLNLGFVPDKTLPDPSQEARALALISQLKCFVCEGQPLAQSHVPLAQDLRLLVRRLIAEGESDEAVLAFITARYGASVLLSPPLTLGTGLLWVLPFLGVGLLGWLFWRGFLRRSS